MKKKMCDCGNPQSQPIPHEHSLPSPKSDCEHVIGNGWLCVKCGGYVRPTEPKVECHLIAGKIIHDERCSIKDQVEIKDWEKRFDQTFVRDDTTDYFHGNVFEDPDILKSFIRSEIAKNEADIRAEALDSAIAVIKKQPAIGHWESDSLIRRKDILAVLKNLQTPDTKQ